MAQHTMGGPNMPRKHEIRIELPENRRLGQAICDALKHGRPTADDADLFVTLRHVSDVVLLAWILQIEDGHN